MELKDRETGDELCNPYVAILLPNHEIPSININSTTFREASKELMLSYSQDLCEILATNKRVYLALAVSKSYEEFSEEGNLEDLDDTPNIVLSNKIKSRVFLGWITEGNLYAYLPKTYSYLYETLKKSLSNMPVPDGDIPF